MNWEYSCGGVVFTRHGGQIRYVLVEEASGKFSFPKGHVEGDETEVETARREIFEETGLRPAFLEGFCLRDSYQLAEKPGTSKRVTYFLAEFGDETLIPREGEIMSIRLLPYEEALPLFRENNQRVLTAAHEFLTK